MLDEVRWVNEWDCLEFVGRKSKSKSKSGICTCSVTDVDSEDG